MRRTNVVAALGAIALGAGLADAQEPPALEAPLDVSVEAPSGTPPEPPAVERPRPTGLAPSGPLLVIPGVTAPPSRRTSLKPAAEPARPALDAPVVEPDIHLRLEPIADDPASDGSARARPARPAPDREPPAEPPTGRVMSPLGRLLGTPTNAGDRDALSIESSGDPAVEAAVKRRVEKQVAEALGGRVEDVDVRVSGRAVTIRARASRLWYRWSARRALEALPMPAGYRARVTLD
ncbi:hypothetical protein [Paludisphaera sp.]|uniref:hypothetical protein n=1 Tax=Paludisphaera sp. TaxID=2017432 RepID=UPI00301E106E